MDVDGTQEQNNAYRICIVADLHEQDVLAFFPRFFPSMQLFRLVFELIVIRVVI